MMTNATTSGNRHDGSPAAGLTMYGADWCGDTRRSKALLERLSVPYDFIDVDEDAAASAWAAAQNGGTRRIPTITFAGGDAVLIEPSDAELTDLLTETGIISKPGGSARS
jgi:glutaredoxin